MFDKHKMRQKSGFIRLLLSHRVLITAMVSALLLLILMAFAANFDDIDNKALFRSSLSAVFAFGSTVPLFVELISEEIRRYEMTQEGGSLILSVELRCKRWVLLLSLWLTSSLELAVSLQDSPSDALLKAAMGSRETCVVIGIASVASTLSKNALRNMHAAVRVVERASMVLSCLAVTVVLGYCVLPQYAAEIFQSTMEIVRLTIVVLLYASFFFPFDNYFDGRNLYRLVTAPSSLSPQHPHQHLTIDRRVIHHQHLTTTMQMLLVLLLLL